MALQLLFEGIISSSTSEIEIYPIRRIKFQRESCVRSRGYFGYFCNAAIQKLSYLSQSLLGARHEYLSKNWGPRLIQNHDTRWEDDEVLG